MKRILNRIMEKIKKKSDERNRIEMNFNARPERETLENGKKGIERCKDKKVSKEKEILIR